MIKGERQIGNGDLTSLIRSNYCHNLEIKMSKSQCMNVREGRQQV